MTAEEKTAEAGRVVSAAGGGVPPLVRFFYLTRGLWNMAAIALALTLKALASSSVPPWAYGLLGVVVLAAQVWRVWAAGFVGRAARGARPVGETLVTAGPYAHVRNPMYLGTALGLLAFAGMGGLWYAVLIVAAVLGAVYTGAIACEEAFLTDSFGEEYRVYREAVPRLLPRLRVGRHARSGRFRLADGLVNESGSLVFLPLYFALFWFVG
jgi:protein-S-isoprenylcysteine O-methyltransferase Ste14